MEYILHTIKIIHKVFNISLFKVSLNNVRQMDYIQIGKLTNINLNVICVLSLESHLSILYLWDVFYTPSKLYTNYLISDQQQDS